MRAQHLLHSRTLTKNGVQCEKEDQRKKRIVKRSGIWQIIEAKIWIKSKVRYRFYFPQKKTESREQDCCKRWKRNLSVVHRDCRLHLVADGRPGAIVKPFVHTVGLECTAANASVAVTISPRGAILPFLFWPKPQFRIQLQRDSRDTCPASRRARLTC